MAEVVVQGILVRDGRVLLVKRTASRVLAPGVWDFPGGHSEEGESPEQTLARELEEELGVVPNRWRALPTHSFDEYGLLVHSFHVSRWTGEPENLQPDEHSEIAWLRLSEVEKLELASPGMLELLQDI